MITDLTEPGIRASSSKLPRYEERRPGEAVSAFVSCFWSFTIPLDAQPFQHAIIPDGTSSIVFIHKRAPDLRLLRLTGPTVSARWIPVNAGDRFLGARLVPGAASELLGVSSGTLRGQVRPLAEVAPQLAGRLQDLLAAAQPAEVAFVAMERELSPLVACASPVDAVVREAVVRLTRTQGDARVADMAAAADISERQFRRRFSRAVGLTPKEFACTIRVRSACIQLASRRASRLAAIAQGVGYADQSHLSREFAQVFGSRAVDLSALIRSFEHDGFGEP